MERLNRYKRLQRLDPATGSDSPLSPTFASALSTSFQNGLIDRMTTRAPTLLALFQAFVSIGMASFGGGLTAWVRREIVSKRGWMDDQQFLSGYALSQLVPGATNVNLAVFIGTH